MPRRLPDSTMARISAAHWSMLVEVRCAHDFVALSARCPSSVIRSVPISIVSWPARTRCGMAVARPERTSATICPVVKPWARSTCSLQPSLPHPASNSSARRRSGLGRRLRRRVVTIEITAPKIWRWGRRIASSRYFDFLSRRWLRRKRSTLSQNSWLRASNKPTYRQRICRAPGRRKISCDRERHTRVIYCLCSEGTRAT
jgi:hypothetical protein